MLTEHGEYQGAIANLHGLEYREMKVEENCLLLFSNIPPRGQFMR